MRDLFYSQKLEGEKLLWTMKKAVGKLKVRQREELRKWQAVKMSQAE